MRSIALALSLSFLALPAQAAELIMYDRDGCYYCLEWKNKVGKYYNQTREGMAVPLTRVDLGERIPSRLAKVRKPVMTPTFVMIHEGREIGRINGYPGEKKFWAMMSYLIKRGGVPTAK